MPPWFSDDEDPLNESAPHPLDQVEYREDSTENEEDLLEYPKHDQEPSSSPPQKDTPATSRSSPISRIIPGPSVSNTPSLVEGQRPKQKLEIRLPKSTLVTPRGRYHGWTPPAPRAKQHTALASLLEHLKSEAGPSLEEDFIEFELDKFSIYVESTIYPCELRPLQQLSTKGPDEFFFDGVLGIGDVKFYVERVAFSELPIGNYGISHASVDDQIWIRSRHNAKKEIYYKLKNPATEYKRFYTPFLWIADLAKHVVDFCGYKTKKNEAVALRDFQQNFLGWLQRSHNKSPSFRRWHKLHGSDDLRTAITANVEFIWKEVYGVLGHRSASSLQVFNEIKHLTQYRPFTSVLGDKRNPVQPSTIVTPYIYECFGLRNFRTAKELEKAEAAIVEDLVASETRRVRKTQRKDLSLTGAHKQLIDNVKAGDTISTPPDGVGTGTKWKREVAKGAKDEHRWFGLVQRVHVSPRTGARSFDVTWLYRPVDTPCCKMVYPWSKELFLSDHCTCEEGRDARVDEDEVIAVHDVEWFGSPETTSAEFFVRQTYQVEQRRWVTLEQKHMVCDHDTPERSGYRPGDTVLAAVSAKQDRADVYEVVKVFKQGSNRFARLRRLRRRDELEVPRPGTKFRPNELVYTDQTVVMKPQRILGRCVVRFFEANEPLPCPYDRNGTANVFFITHKLENGTCVPLSGYNRPTTMCQGFDPKRPVKKLKGLDLFCGSGNFGRGLEEGGAVDMCWANDIWTEAIHTYMVNASHHTKPFLGSVDDLLRRAIEGDRGVPRRGDVDFISGGSPCQGFSLITADKTHDRQKKNRSLVASFASFVDFYRPRYGILENVPSIVQTGRNRDEDAFSQLVCAVVGMGYQTQLALGDAWTYGAPQARSRAFLYFAAPGHRLPDPPRPSHSHFGGVRGRDLGIMTNGESFVSRSFDPAAFGFVTAAAATADLPDIQDAKPDFCVGHPDHRVSIGVTPRSRAQYDRIPTRPRGMNFARAWDGGGGVMTAAERELLFPAAGRRVEPGSHGWGRVLPGGVFRTITTSVTPADARTGRFLHWRESRPVTILEARRAQGFLDCEVLVGGPGAQYELVGNSVARPMALALGLQFREAWVGSLYEERERVPVSAPQMGGVKGEGGMEQEGGMDWDDDGDSLFVGNSRDYAEDIANGADTMGTPATSVLEAEAEALPSGAARKRPLSESLGVGMRASKVRKLEAHDEDATAMGEGSPGSPMTNGNVVVSSSVTVLVERGQVDLASADGASNGNLAVRSVIDLTVAGSESGVAVVQSAGDMVIDLTGD